MPNLVTNRARTDFRPLASVPHAHVDRHVLLRLTTSRATEFVDMTDRLAAFVEASGIATGVLCVQSLHTTAAIVVNEHEPQLLTDFEAHLEATAPTDARYAHDDLAVRRVNLTPDERANGHAHCRALLLGSTACLGIVNGRLPLGRWQRVFLVELDGPRERTVAATIAGGA